MEWFFADILSLFTLLFLLFLFQLCRLASCGVCGVLPLVVVVTLGGALPGESFRLIHVIERVEPELKSK